MKQYLKWAMLIAVLAAFSAAGCSDDDDGGPMAPTTGSVSGKVTFVGTWPASGEIQVSVYTGLTPPWVPTGPPEAFTDPIPVSNEYDYVLEGLDFGDYSAVYVSWRDPAMPANSKLLGMFWAFPDSVGINAQTGLPKEMPSDFTIQSSFPDFTNYNITGGSRSRQLR